MGGKGRLLWPGHAYAGSGMKWLPPRRTFAVVIMWGMALKSGGVKVEPYRRMIKAFMVFLRVYSIL